ncbi:MAG: Gfo/Idh/MocA family oxidoreductase [Ignavibacteriaceae bacterium]|jgi:predicted dehydrogenase
MKVIVLGLGYWGPNLVRNFLGNRDITGVIGCDKNPARVQFINDRFPGVQTCDNFEKALKDPDVKIVAIATPVDTHFKFAKKSLEANKNIWVEKPFTATSEEANELITIAEKRNLKIFVDHTFIYTGAVRKIKELIDANSLGEVIYFDSVRVNLGLFQHDVNVIWDLAPHDLSIMDYLINKKVKAVTANGIANYYKHENVAHISVYFEDNCFAHFHVNWTSPVKIRRMLIGGKKKMLVFDDMENSEKVKVYDSGIEIKNTEKIYDALVQYRIGDMHSPIVNQTEALALGVKEFISAIKEDRKPLTSGEEGLKVVKILEAAEKSIKAKGMLVEIQ